MNDDNYTHNQGSSHNTSNDLSESPSNDSGTPGQMPQKERIIQPSASASMSTDSVNIDMPKIDVRSVYPDATNAVKSSSLGSSQQAAIAATRQHSANIDKPVSQRVKPLLILAVLGIIMAIYSLVVMMGMLETGIFGTILFLVGLVQLGMAVYLLIGKDHNTVALILKIYLTFQILSLLGSIANPIYLVINLVLVIFIFSVYQQVKSLDYY